VIPLKSWLKVCYRLKKKKRLRKFVTVRGVLEGKKKKKNLETLRIYIVVRVRLEAIKKKIML
jgi:hypothetical protein